MSRYRGPKIRVLKRLGPLPGFGLKVNQKFEKIKKLKKINKRFWNTPRNRKSSFSVRLKEKQKLRYHYGLTEKNLLKYIREAKVKARKKQTSTSKTLLRDLEMRLDNIVFKLGFAPTLPSARQLVTHGHVYLNGKKTTIPSYECSRNDLIKVKKPLKQKIEIKKFQPFLNRKNYRRKTHESEYNLNINELLILEYYSRNI
uniref:Small ribosomal subunit protein uS4c n=1 Tax=Chlorodesmis fastigiata TaxID=189431 RepID=A0A2P0QHE7_CHLFS|nr:ribosomal protein S4 [Chlorodesmis fastigiata]ARO74193.1 ribosomal protein S4 [Chlorodesmis fastigiata]